MEPEAASAPASAILSLTDAIAALKNLERDGQNRQLDIERISTSVIHADFTALQSARAQLHPLEDFVPFVTTLHASLAKVSRDTPLLPHLLSELTHLVSVATPCHARQAPSQWAGACRHGARLVIESHDIPRALALIRPLRAAADILALNPECLVPIHADFLAVCLEAKCYRWAARWIRERRRDEIRQETSIMATDVHLIHHYSALVFIGVKDYRAALQSCRLALAVPSPSPGSFFQVALSTYKYFILLHLLLTGKAPTPLKFSSYQPARLRKAASEYVELAAAYERMDCSQMQQIFQSNVHLYEKHNTLGLVKQVVTALSKQLIIRLTNSFATMKLQDVATRSNLSSEEEAHAVILDMIKTGNISATIDDRKKIVMLRDNDDVNDDMLSSQLSGEYMNNCLSVVQRIEEFRQKLECDPVYVIKEMSSGNGKRQEGSGKMGRNGRTMGSRGFDTEYMK